MSTIIRYKQVGITRSAIKFEVGIPDSEGKMTMKSVNLTVGHLENSSTTLEDDLKQVLLVQYFHPEANIQLEEIPNV